MTTLGPICSFLNGGTPSRVVSRYYQGDVPWITGADISGARADTARRFITEEAIRESATNRVPAGTVLLVTRTSVGKVAVAAMELCFSQDITAITPDPHCLDTSYLVHFFRTKQPHLERLARGATIKGVTREAVANLAISLPPLAEQRRIAGILDAADALRAKRREALAQLDTLLQSTFLDMFGDPVTNPMGLRRESLKSAFEFTTGKLDSNAAVEGGKYPFFTCARETYAIDDYAFDCEALLLAGNNANADYSVKHYKGRFNAYQRTYVITIKESALTYAYARLVLEYLLGDLKRFSKGTNTKYLTLVILNRMPILVPPLDLQRRFAAVVESIEEQKVRQRAHLAELDTLFASLQSRAFRGDL